MRPSFSPRYLSLIERGLVRSGRLEVRVHGVRVPELGAAQTVGEVALVLDKSRDGKKIRRYLPRDVVRLLRVLDKEWKRRSSQGEYSVAWRVATVALLGSAYGCDEMVTLYFLATRCDASLAFFTVAWLATQLLQLPSALVRAYPVQSFVGALAEDDWGILGSAFRKAPVALVVVWVVVAVVAENVGGNRIVRYKLRCGMLIKFKPLDLPGGLARVKVRRKSGGERDRCGGQLLAPRGERRAQLVEMRTKHMAHAVRVAAAEEQRVGRQAERRRSTSHLG